jgi:hypothetical protein
MMKRGEGLASRVRKVESVERSVPNTLEPEEDVSVRCDGGMKLLCAPKRW